MVVVEASFRPGFVADERPGTAHRRSLRRLDHDHIGAELAEALALSEHRGGVDDVSALHRNDLTRRDVLDGEQPATLDRAQRALPRLG